MQLSIPVSGICLLALFCRGLLPVVLVVERSVAYPRTWHSPFLPHRCLSRYLTGLQMNVGVRGSSNSLPSASLCGQNSLWTLFHVSETSSVKLGGRCFLDVWFVFWSSRGSRESGGGKAVPSEWKHLTLGGSNRWGQLFSTVEYLLKRLPEFPFSYSLLLAWKIELLMVHSCSPDMNTEHFIWLLISTSPVVSLSLPSVGSPQGKEEPHPRTSRGWAHILSLIH